MFKYILDFPLLDFVWLFNERLSPWSYRYAKFPEAISQFISLFFNTVLWTVVTLFYTILSILLMSAIQRVARLHFS